MSKILIIVIVTAVILKLDTVFAVHEIRLHVQNGDLGCSVTNSPKVHANKPLYIIVDNHPTTEITCRSKDSHEFLHQNTSDYMRKHLGTTNITVGQVYDAMSTTWYCTLDRFKMKASRTVECIFNITVLGTSNVNIEMNGVLRHFVNPQLTRDKDHSEDYQFMQTTHYFKDGEMFDLLCNKLEGRIKMVYFKGDGTRDLLVYFSTQKISTSEIRFQSRMTAERQKSKLSIHYYPSVGNPIAFHINFLKSSREVSPGNKAKAAWKTYQDLRVTGLENSNIMHQYTDSYENSPAWLVHYKYEDKQPLAITCLGKEFRDNLQWKFWPSGSEIIQTTSGNLATSVLSMTPSAAYDGKNATCQAFSGSEAKSYVIIMFHSKWAPTTNTGISITKDNNAVQNGKPKPYNVGAIAGGVVIFFLILNLLGFLYLFRKRKRAAMRETPYENISSDPIPRLNHTRHESTEYEYNYPELYPISVMARNSAYCGRKTPDADKTVNSQINLGAIGTAEYINVNEDPDVSINNEKKDRLQRSVKDQIQRHPYSEARAMDIKNTAGANSKESKRREVHETDDYVNDLSGGRYANTKLRDHYVSPIGRQDNDGADNQSNVIYSYADPAYIMLRR